MIYTCCYLTFDGLYRQLCVFIRQMCHAVYSVAALMFRQAADISYKPAWPKFHKALWSSPHWVLLAAWRFNTCDMVIGWISTGASSLISKLLDSCKSGHRNPRERKMRQTLWQQLTSVACLSLVRVRQALRPLTAPASAVARYQRTSVCCRGPEKRECQQREPIGTDCHESHNACCSLGTIIPLGGKPILGCFTIGDTLPVDFWE